MNVAIAILLLLAAGCAVAITPPEPIAEKTLAIGGGHAQAQVITPAPPPLFGLEGDLPADTSNLNLWQVWEADSPSGPFQFSELLFTNHFVLWRTNAQRFFQFYGLND